MEVCCFTLSEILDVNMTAFGNYGHVNKTADRIYYGLALLRIKIIKDKAAVNFNEICQKNNFIILWN